MTLKPSGLRGSASATVTCTTAVYNSVPIASNTRRGYAEAATVMIVGHLWRIAPLLAHDLGDLQRRSPIAGVKYQYKQGHITLHTPTSSSMRYHWAHQRADARP